MSFDYQKVINIIKNELGVDEELLTEESNFTRDLGADSLDTVELIMEIEKEFKITITDNEAEDIVTVGDVINCVSTKTEA